VAKREIVTHSSEETIERGREIGAALKAPALILLSGDLGAGKTTLTKGIVSGLGAAREEDVTSPTFTLVHKYENGTRVYHVDLYRVVSFPDFETLGLEDVFSEQAIVIVEWSEKFALRTEWPVVRIHLEHVAEDARRISIEDAANAAKC
jgi:tRNA threonylcarbamoyladenosine biosynthesis protein TsaE